MRTFLPLLLAAALTGQESQELALRGQPEAFPIEDDLLADRSPCPSQVIFEKSACDPSPERREIEQNKKHTQGCCPDETISEPNQVCEIYDGIYSNLFSATPCLADKAKSTWGVRLDAAVLAWQAREEGLEIALRNSPQFTTDQYGSYPVRSDINGQFVNMKFDWAPGARVDLKVDFPKNWDMDFCWTFFYSHSAHGTSEPITLQGNGLFAVWLPPNATRVRPQVYQSAHGDWKLHFNTIDWAMGSSWFVTPKLSLRLEAGLKAVWVKQDFSARYASGFPIPGDQQPLSAHAQASSNAFGVGPRIGFSSRWYLKKGWSLFGNFAGALPLYDFRIKRTDFDATKSLIGPTVATNNSSWRERIYLYRPNLESAAGVSWDTCWGKRKQFSFGWDASYDIQYFWEQNLMSGLVASPLVYLPFPLRGDLCLQGATFNFRFGY